MGYAAADSTATSALPTGAGIDAGKVHIFYGHILAAGHSCS
jgi:hypothetical protein